MSQTVALFRPLTPGPSRFRVRVHFASPGLKPYGWEIVDEDDDRTVRRSAQRFRNSAEAWAAGLAVLAKNDALTALTPSPW